MVNQLQRKKWEWAMGKILIELHIFLMYTETYFYDYFILVLAIIVTQNCMLDICFNHIEYRYMFLDY